jgi:aspartyl protease family protein
MHRLREFWVVIGHLHSVAGQMESGKGKRPLVKYQRIWISLLSLCLALTTLPAGAQLSVSQLEQQLQDAVAQKNWPQALQIVDRLIPLAPGQASQLKPYRTQIEQLSRNSVSSPKQLQTATQPLGVVVIKRRSGGGVPVIDVVFNQRKTFEMLVDSGAGITVITRPMATALGLGTAQVVDYRTFSTANGLTKMPIVYLNAVTVGGLTKTQVPVAIAGPDMDIGLLGQDFLQRYDVSLRGSRIEFHDR